MSRLTRDGTAEPTSRDQILRHARGQENIIFPEYYFPCSADHEQDWQPYPVDPYSAICDGHTYIHTYIHTYKEHQIDFAFHKLLKRYMKAQQLVQCMVPRALFGGVRNTSKSVYSSDS